MFSRIGVVRCRSLLSNSVLHAVMARLLPNRAIVVSACIRPAADAARGHHLLRCHSSAPYASGIGLLGWRQQRWKPTRRGPGRIFEESPLLTSGCGGLDDCQRPASVATKYTASKTAWFMGHRIRMALHAGSKRLLDATSGRDLHRGKAMHSDHGASWALRASPAACRACPRAESTTLQREVLPPQRSQRRSGVEYAHETVNHPTCTRISRPRYTSGRPFHLFRTRLTGLGPVLPGNER